MTAEATRAQRPRLVSAIHRLFGRFRWRHRFRHRHRHRRRARRRRGPLRMLK